MARRIVLERIIFVMAVAGVVGWAAWVTRGDEGKDPKDGAAWSAEVNGVKARINLQRAQVLNGTPLIATRLELKNVSDVANPLKFPWSKGQLKFRVEDGSGKELPTGSVSYDGMVAEPLDLVLPHKAELSFDISCHGAGVGGDHAAQIDLGSMSTWVIPRDGKEYFLKATLEIAQVGHDPAWFGWYGKLEIPAVKIPTKLEALDPAATGKLIEELGPKMLGKNGQESEEAVRRLSLIDDERVIPWYLKAGETNNYELKYAALDRLSRLKGDAALGGLKKGMSTQGADIGNCTTPKVAAECADNIRLSAAVALARSPHPDAKKLLLTMWQDSSTGVRNTVAQTAAAMDTAESLAILEKLTQDPDEGVRNEAARCLKERKIRQAGGTVERKGGGGGR